MNGGMMANDEATPTDRDTKDVEMTILKKVMDELRKLDAGRSRRRVMRYINERLEDERRISEGLPPAEET